ncbi:amino acid/polyamine transporter I [Xylariomycetidae sp. FL0641]|nr:amino acid/polyamine transporter I [Xylariomycetidae sp. FL0641]
MNGKDIELEPPARKAPIEPAIFERHAREDGHPVSLEKQTRIRRLFSYSQLFAFSLTYMGTWETIFMNSYFALANGGPNALFFSYILCFVGAMAQASSIGEMASMIPIAGAQYHWAWNLAPPSAKRFTTWIQGWMTWFGYVSLLASSANYTSLLLESLIASIYHDYSPGSWHTTALVIGMVIIITLLNTYCFRAVPYLELLWGILHLTLFVVFIVVMTVMGTRNDSSIFLEKSVTSGWRDNYGLAWNVGSLSGIWLFTGFDSVIHMSEETRAAKEAVPRAMFWSIVTNGLMGLAMLIAYLIAMGPLEEVQGYKFPSAGVIRHVTNSDAATTTLMSFLFVGSFCSVLAGVASVSRLTWAWSRDGGLPAYFSFVDGKRRVPSRAVVITVAIIALMSLLNLSSGSYVVFGAIAALGSLALYISYAIAIGCMIYSRFATTVPFGAWNLGRYGLFINCFAMVYTLWAIIFLPFPQDLPVTATTMNYASPVLGLVLAIAIALWIFRARTHWAGPNLTIIDFIVRNS